VVVMGGGMGVMVMVMRVGVMMVMGRKTRRR
jgi:hypothetical protein